MPRTYITEDGENIPHDFCNSCFTRAGFADGDADDHPDYGDTDYTCDRCGKRLARKDN